LPCLLAILFYFFLYTHFDSKENFNREEIKSSLHCEAYRSWRGLKAFPIRGQKRSVTGRPQGNAFSFIDSHITERTNLLEILHGCWYRLRTKAT
jgi:hypothetical protein